MEKRTDDDINVLPESSDEDFSNEEQGSVENVLKLVKSAAQLSVDNIECTPGSQQGDNYMSIIKRVQVRGKRRMCSGKSKVFSISLIFKRQFLNPQRRKLFRSDEAFANEITVYDQLIPVMKRFSQDRLPFPVCHYAGKDSEGDLIVMEDLTYCGFHMVDRRQNLSYRQCRTVVEELANFHAVSLAMKLVKPAQFENMKQKVTEIVYTDAAAEFYTRSLETSLRGLQINQLDFIVAFVEHEIVYPGITVTQNFIRFVTAAHNCRHDLIHSTTEVFYCFNSGIKTTIFIAVV